MLLVDFRVGRRQNARLGNGRTRRMQSPSGNVCMYPAYNSLRPWTRKAALFLNDADKARGSNETTGKPGDPRENPPTNGIVRLDSDMQKSGSDPAEDRTRFALVGGELLASHWFTPGFSQVGIMLDNAACWRFFSGISRFPRPCILVLLLSHLISSSSALKTPISQFNLIQVVVTLLSCRFEPMILASRNMSGGDPQLENVESAATVSGFSRGTTVSFHLLSRRRSTHTTSYLTHPPSRPERRGWGWDEFSNVLGLFPFWRSSLWTGKNQWLEVPEIKSSQPEIPGIASFARVFQQEENLHTRLNPSPNRVWTTHCRCVRLEAGDVCRGFSSVLSAVLRSGRPVRREGGGRRRQPDVRGTTHVLGPAEARERFLIVRELLISRNGEPGSIPGWTMQLVGGFSQGSPFSHRPFISALHHAHLASPSSALKTSILRAAQISSLTHFNRRVDWLVCAQRTFKDIRLHGAKSQYTLQAEFDRNLVCRLMCTIPCSTQVSKVYLTDATLGIQDIQGHPRIANLHVQDVQVMMSELCEKMRHRLYVPARYATRQFGDLFAAVDLATLVIRLNGCA
ncbi:hypothetical protein PR048_007921 [Dryococelus australis]|uniref:Uncharacterized protein n=1 Tax=Dryococelus australis TaxID=614101 RepID=A0ABQ9HVN1_9NEOP|nr:hypothetical protein PR048_007921 [Dryococelus australis]